MQESVVKSGATLRARQVRMNQDQLVGLRKHHARRILGESRAAGNRLPAGKMQ
jgi:hypothetical protein